jgi:glyoxylate/hydroxypyruvate reductase A
LLVALDQEFIAHAVLDVFKQEPLPTDHPFWSHPKVTLTPHSSSRSDVKQTAEQVVNYYQSLKEVLIYS